MKESRTPREARPFGHSMPRVYFQEKIDDLTEWMYSKNEAMREEARIMAAMRSVNYQAV